MVEEQTQQPVINASNVQNQAPSDISKKTIIVLVVLTVVISMLGTYTVINELHNVKPIAKQGSSQANVQFSITQPTTSTPQPDTKAVGAATGNVAFQILPN
jgi:hypothetical protein